MTAGCCSPSSVAEDMVNTELSVAFSSLRGISAGQFLELRAPQGFSFLQRSFSPGEGAMFVLMQHIRRDLTYFDMGFVESDTILTSIVHIGPLF